MKSWAAPWLRIENFIVGNAAFVFIVLAVALGFTAHDNVELIALPLACAVILIQIRKRPFELMDAVFISLLLAPFIAFFCAAVIHPHGVEGVDQLAALPKFWLKYGAISIVLTLGVISVPNWRESAQVALPFSLLLLFVLLTLDRFDPNEVYGSREVCRLTARVGLPFTPALVISCFSLLYFALAPSLGRYAMELSGLCVMASVIVVVGYTASRGVFIGLFAGCFLFAGILLFYRQQFWQRRLALLMIALISGFGASIFVDIVHGCNGISRFHAVLNPGDDPSDELIQSTHLIPAISAEEAQEQPSQALSDKQNSPLSPNVGSVDAANQDVPKQLETVTHHTSYNAVTLRLAFWEMARQHIAQSAFIGTGRLGEVALTRDSSHDHVHQQYLSWLIWFGGIGLLAGMMNLLAPLAAFRRLPAGQERALICICIGSVFPITLFFDSLMRLEQYIIFQVMYSAIFYTIIRNTSEPSSILAKSNDTLKDGSSNTMYEDSTFTEV